MTHVAVHPILETVSFTVTMLPWRFLHSNTPREMVPCADVVPPMTNSTLKALLEVVILRMAMLTRLVLPKDDRILEVIFPRGNIPFLMAKIIITWPGGGEPCRPSLFRDHISSSHT